MRVSGLQVKAEGLKGRQVALRNDIKCKLTLLFCLELLGNFYRESCWSKLKVLLMKVSEGSS